MLEVAAGPGQAIRDCALFRFRAHQFEARSHVEILRFGLLSVRILFKAVIWAGCESRARVPAAYLSAVERPPIGQIYRDTASWPSAAGLAERSRDLARDRGLPSYFG